MGRRLYVGNLPYSATEDQLTELFGRAGKVDNVRVMRDMATGRARGFAFVEMAPTKMLKRPSPSSTSIRWRAGPLSSTRRVPSPRAVLVAAGGGRDVVVTAVEAAAAATTMATSQGTPQGAALVGRLFKMQE